MQQVSWNKLQEDANNVHHTSPPVRRTQQLVQLADSFTDEQRVAATQRRFSYDGQASAFVWNNRQHLRYVPQREKWLYWDNHVWRWDETGRADELVKAQGREFLLQTTQDADHNKLLKQWHAKLTTPGGIHSVLKLASTDPMMAAPIEAFDADIYALNTPGGIVNLYTGEMTPATPDSLVRRSTRVTPDASCPTPLYDQFMAQSFAGEPDLSDYIEQMIGMALIKAQDDQVFMYLYGAAGSGKGTLMNMALELLGKDENGYAVNVDSAMFVQSRSTPHPTELMQFLGARMAISSEVSQGSKMDTGKLKKTTGGDPITGRYMQKDFVTFDATHTLFIMANDRLEVPHGDAGVWRRLRVVEFKHQKKEGIIGGLGSRIIEQEGPGVLARWIAKAQKFLNEGYVTPDAVIDAGTRYVKESDTVAEWIDDCIDTHDMESNFVAREALRDSYVSWTRREKRTPLGNREFSQALASNGFTATKKYVQIDTVGGPKKQMRGFFGLAIS